jgi:N-methylhydantoinase A
MGSSAGFAATTEPTGALRVAVDVGGTFTDAAILDELARTVRFDKVATTPTDPAVGVLDTFRKAGVHPGQVARVFVNGNTLALNALLTRTGASLALVTTEGFRDVYELGRTDRAVMYDITYHKPPSLVPRRLVFEVPERMDFEGRVLQPLEEASAARVAAAVAAAGVRAVAVCFLQSYANPAHEQRMAEILREHCPEIDVTLSHELVREYREYERTSTAVIDAYVKPVVRGYLEHLRDELEARGFTGRALVSRSGGGAMTFEAAAQQPAHLVLSGPAGGVIGAAAFAAAVDEPNLVTIDMGGTSLDVSLIVAGAPTTQNEATLEGLPISLPSLNIRTIGAGGGSIAWLDEAGHMQVGPQSAAAVPGPASYDRGGSEATVTDAALYIGYLGEHTALGGELRLRRDLAEAAIERLAEAMGLDARTVALGIWTMLGVRVTGAVREISIEQGHDPADFALLAFGGGGGLIASDVARQLGIPKVLVPPGPGAFCAFGMLFTDVIHDFAQTRVVELRGADAGDLTALYEALEHRARRALEADGFASDNSTIVRSASLRFAGQEHTVDIEIPGGTLTDVELAERSEAFGRLHLERYGHRMDDPVELVTARVRAIGHVPRPDLPRAGTGDMTRARRGVRKVYLGQTAGSVDYAVYGREYLGRGDVVRGPAIIEEYTATTVVHEADVCTVGEHGELAIAIGAQQHRTRRGRR